MAESKQERALEDKLLGVKGSKGKAWKAAGTGAKAPGKRKKAGLSLPMHQMPKGGAC